MAAALDLDRPLPAGLPPRPPPIRRPPARAHRAERRRPPAQRPGPGPLRRGHHRGRHAAVRPLAVLRRRDGRRSTRSSCACGCPRCSRCRGIGGRAQTRGSDNYYHFLTDVLPRLELLRRAGCRARCLPGQPQHPVPARHARPPRPHGRPLPRHEYPHLRADELVVPSLPDANLKTPPWIVPWLRAQFLPDPTRWPRPTAASTSGGATRSTPVASRTRPSCSTAWSRSASSPSTPARCRPPNRCGAFAEAECVVGAHGAGPDQPRLRARGVASSSSSPATTSTSASGRWPAPWRVCAIATSSATGRRPRTEAQPRGGLGHQRSTPAGPAAPRATSSRRPRRDAASLPQQ